MTTPIACPACGGSAITEHRYAQDLEFKGIDLHVSDLVQYVCESCDYSFESHAQHDANIDTIRGAFLAARTAFKVEHGLLTGEQIRDVRKMLGLTQHEAAEHFGGGLNAFSKYENEEIVQSVAMDRLIRLVAHLGHFGLEALKTSATRAPLPLGVLRQSNTGASTQVVDINASKGLLVAIHQYFGRPQAQRQTYLPVSPEPWASLFLESPFESIHTPVAELAGTGIVEIRTTGRKLQSATAGHIEAATFRTNPLTGALYRHKRTKIKEGVRE